MKRYSITTLILIATILPTGCSTQKTTSQVESPDYPISPVPFTMVQVTDNLWSSRIETNRTVTIPSSFRKCEETGRIDNFAIAAGIKEGEFQSKYPYDDSDVYKIMEGAAYSLAAHPDPELEQYLDELIAMISQAQEDDGYLMTWRTIDPNRPPTDWAGESRWANTRDGHELYNVGHMYEAAVAHYQATGKKEFLNIALKNADLITATFGPGKLMSPPGHEEIEIGLMKLYRVTGNRKYLETAEFFLDQRGNQEGHKLYGPTHQDHLPVSEQTEAVGHAVRAGYLYSAMTDAAALGERNDYRTALDRIWENLTGRKIYIIGGIGSTRGNEAFGDDYILPNRTSYCETCAAIANILWNQRMFLLTGEGRYIDVLERALYNNLLAGVSLKGDTFFYPNVLEFDGIEPFNYGVAGRSEWFNCSCCPSNVARFIPSVPGYVYTTGDDSVFINLYIQSEAKIPWQGSMVKISQATSYPRDGQILIKIHPGDRDDFQLKLRIPGWARNQPIPGDLYSFQKPGQDTFTVSKNGGKVDIAVKDGYITLPGPWDEGDRVELNLPMSVRLVQSNPKVMENRDKIAVQRGPMVYCAEAVDNEGSALDLTLPADPVFSERPGDDLPPGTILLSCGSAEGRITLIPYSLWANREVGEMKVWFPQK